MAISMRTAAQRGSLQPKHPQNTTCKDTFMWHKSRLIFIGNMQDACTIAEISLRIKIRVGCACAEWTLAKTQEAPSQEQKEEA